MSRIQEPYTIHKRSDSETYRFTLNPPCGLPDDICKEWYKSSFQRLPDDLAQYRNPKTKPERKTSVLALISYFKRNLELAKDNCRLTLQLITIEDFARDMFTDGAAHLTRWAAKGHTLKSNTVTQHRHHLVDYLIPKFGQCTLGEIRPAAVEDFLLDQKLANSTRNSIMYTLKLVMKEARREGIIYVVPGREPFKRNSKRQDILSNEELTALFPTDEQELIKVWRRSDDMRKEKDEIALMFGTLFCVAVSAGLRSGEVRALHQEQVSIPYSGLAIDRAFDEQGELGLLKKASEEDDRRRAVLIPEITIKILVRWLDRVRECPGFPGLIFSYREKPVSNYYILDRLKYGFSRMGIDYEKRRLTTHCLRYTYNTRMRALLSAQTLREFMGHKSEAMTDLYDNPILLERLAAFQKEKPSVEQFWDHIKDNQETKALEFKVS
jgi:integrase